MKLKINQVLYIQVDKDININVISLFIESLLKLSGKKGYTLNYPIK